MFTATSLYGLVVLICVAIGVFVRVRYVLKLKQYGHRLDPIVVRSEYEGDRTVCKRADRERDMLIRAGNRMGVVVYECIHGEGEHYGETWDEFQERAYQFELAVCKQHRAEWQKVNRKHFNAIAMNQKGVEWDVTYISG